MRQAICVSLITGLCFGCNRVPDSAPPSTVKEVIDVAVTSQPLLEMATFVGGELLNVRLVVPSERTSRTWRPSKSAVRKLQDARLILINGAGYEPWTSRVSLPGSRLKDTAAGYSEQFVRIPDAVTHQHGPEGKHSHAGTVWATWLDPRLATAQLHQVTEALVGLQPEQATVFESSSARLRTQLEALDVQISKLAEDTRASPPTVLSDGPHYHYLTNRLNWTIHYLHWDEDGSLSEIDREELAAALKGKAASDPRIFLMSTRRPASDETFVASQGLTVVRIDLCEFSSDSGMPFIQRMQSNLNRLKSATSISQ